MSQPTNTAISRSRSGTRVVGSAASCPSKPTTPLPAGRWRFCCALAERLWARSQRALSCAWCVISAASGLIPASPTAANDTLGSPRSWPCAQHCLNPLRREELELPAQCRSPDRGQHLGARHPPCGHVADQTLCKLHLLHALRRGRAV